MSPVFVAAIFLGLSALSSASEKKVDWIDLFWRRIDKLPNVDGEAPSLGIHRHSGFYDDAMAGKAKTQKPENRLLLHFAKRAPATAANLATGYHLS
jgi:hypothetical protein